MAAPTKKIFTIGLNAVRIYDLDQDNGYMAATAATSAYDGLSPAPVAFEYSHPDPETINHPGNNQVLQQDALPSLESSSGTLQISRLDHDTVSILTNTLVNTFGDVNSIGWRTNQQGTEPTVALVAYAQGKTPAGLRVWSTYVFPKCVIIPKPKGMSREQENLQFFVQPQFSTAHLVGLTYGATTDGYTSAELNEYQSNYRLHFASWLVGATETTFPFAATLNYTNNGSAGITVTKNGTLMTYAATAALDTEYYADASGITFGAALTNGDVVQAMYELADSALDVE